MEAIQSFDLTVLNAIQNALKCGFLDFLAVFISYLTTSGIIWIAAGVVMLFFKKTRAVGIMVLMGLALGYLSGDVLLKHLVNRPRPFTVNTDIALLINQPSGASFPSTHSVLAASVTTVLLTKKRTLGFIALALTVIIAFSRLYLYVHYPTDVLCGLLVGVLCGTAALLIAKAFKLESRLSKNRAA